MATASTSVPRPTGVAVLVVGLMLQAGVTGAVKVSAKLLVGQPLDTSDGQSASVPDG
jgi:hypothetical protein